MNLNFLRRRNIFDPSNDPDNDGDVHQPVAGTDTFRRSPLLGMTSDNLQNLDSTNSADANPQISQALASANQPNNLQNPQNFQTPILDKYSQFLNQAPNPNDPRFKPGFGRKLVAGLSGLGASSPSEALGVQNYILDEPYNKEMQNYSTKAKLYGEGANIEERSITNKRLMQHEAQMDEVRRIHQDEINRANAAKEDLTQQLRDRQNMDAETRRMNANINDYKKDHPRAIIQAIPGGNLIAIDPITHETEDLGISSGKMDDSTKMHIQLQNQLSEIHARIEGQKAVEGIKSGNRASDIVSRGAEARKTKVSPGTTKPQETTETTIEPTKTGGQTLHRTTKYGGYVPSPYDTNPVQGSKAMIKVKTPDGRTVDVPADKIEEAVKNGGVIIK